MSGTRLHTTTGVVALFAMLTVALFRPGDQHHHAHGGAPPCAACVASHAPAIIDTRAPVIERPTAASERIVEPVVATPVAYSPASPGSRAPPSA